MSIDLIESNNINHRQHNEYIFFFIDHEPGNYGYWL